MFSYLMRDGDGGIEISLHKKPTDGPLNSQRLLEQTTTASKTTLSASPARTQRCEVSSNSCSRHLRGLTVDRRRTR